MASLAAPGELGLSHYKLVCPEPNGRVKRDPNWNGWDNKSDWCYNPIKIMAKANSDFGYWRW
jgi:hypothetical protein